MESMASILASLKLESLIDTFDKHMVTPDIVHLLSAHDFTEIGVHSRADMIAVRDACKFASENSTTLREGSSSQRFAIPRNVLKDLLDEGFAVREVASILSVSESTIHRRMWEYGLAKMSFLRISDDEIYEIGRALSREFPFCNKIHLERALLERRGAQVQGWRLRDCVNRLTPYQMKRRERSTERQIGSLRGNYSRDVNGPNQLWHVATDYSCLIRWHLVVIGGIDGFTQLPVMIQCTDNVKPSTLLECFKAAVEVHGLPSRVRSDMGMENGDIADFMISKRGPGRGSIITGKACHNKRTGILWKEVYPGVIKFYNELFTFMEEDIGILDPLDELHVIALHYVFLPKINEQLVAWRSAWSKQRLRFTKSTQLQLLVTGQVQDPVDVELSRSDIPHYGIDGYVYHFEGRDSTKVPLQPLSVELSEACLQELSAKIPLPWTSTNFGIELYKRALEIIKTHLQEKE